MSDDDYPFAYEREEFNAAADAYSEREPPDPADYDGAGEPRAKSLMRRSASAAPLRVAEPLDDPHMQDRTAGGPTSA